MEMPLYHVPNMRTFCSSVWRRAVEFVKKAGSTIVVVSLLIWLFSTLPGGGLEQSYLAGFGRFFSPVGSLLGFDWRLIVALFAGFIAKENTLATLAVLFGAGEGAALGGLIVSAYSPASGLAFMVSQLLFIPCVATLAAIRQESGSWRLTLFNVFYLLFLSAAVSLAVFQAARWLGL